MKCADCKFWEPVGGYIEGRCRRHAPRAGEVENAFWPSTAGKDWCGEFSPREGDQEAARAAAAFAKEKGIPVGDVMVTRKKDEGFVFAVFDCVAACDPKPCAKCGATTTHGVIFTGQGYKIACSECGAGTSEFSAPAIAVEAWNQGDVKGGKTE